MYFKTFTIALMLCLSSVIGYTQTAQVVSATAVYAKGQANRDGSYSAWVFEPQHRNQGTATANKSTAATRVYSAPINVEDFTSAGLYFYDKNTPTIAGATNAVVALELKIFGTAVDGASSPLFISGASGTGGNIDWRFSPLAIKRASETIASTTPGNVHYNSLLNTFGLYEVDLTAVKYIMFESTVKNNDSGGVALSIISHPSPVLEIGLK